jgi:hypothetical protein
MKRQVSKFRVFTNLATSLMNIQTDFDDIVTLLQSQVGTDRFVDEILSHKEAELKFWRFDMESDGTRKEHLLSVYEHRHKMHEVLRIVGIEGWEPLLSRLREAQHEHICISGIISHVGTYLVFSDFAKKDLIGILKSQVTLDKIREENRAHKARVEANGHRVLTDTEANENVFIGGRLRTT